MNWAFSALVAAILWGACYAIADLLIKKYSIPYFTVFLFQGVIHFIIILCIAFYLWYIGTNFLLNTTYPVIGLLIFDCILGVSASLLTYFAIFQKNAVLAAFIEISYPFFTMIISMLILATFSVNWMHVLGGILIFVGSGLVMIGG